MYVRSYISIQRQLHIAMKREYDFSQGIRGAVIPSPGKTKITIRIDDDILEFFRDQANAAGGGSYQTMINGALRDFVQGRRTAEIVREVVREELARTGKGRRRKG